MKKKKIEIELEDLLNLIDCIKHLGSLEDTLKINKILEKYNIDRRIKW